MAYERIWQFLPMQGPHTAATMADTTAWPMWVLKSFLKGEIGGATQGLWTCIGSSDGTTGALDGVDRWTTTYDVTKIPRANADNLAHGWMVLGRDITVNSILYHVKILLSNRAFSAANGARLVNMSFGVTSGGSNTADPAQTQVFHLGYPSYTNSMSYDADFTNSRRVYGGLTSLGEFWMAETIAGEIASAICMWAPVGTKASDQTPFFGMSPQTSPPNQSYPFHGQTMYDRSQGLTGATQFYNGATGATVALNQPPAFALLDVIDTSVFDYPAYVTVGNSTNPSSIHSRGRLPDTGVCAGVLSGAPSGGRPCNPGTTLRDLGGNVVYVTLNQIILPYNALLS